MKGIEALKKVANVTPKGFRAPGIATMTKYMFPVLEEHGFIYDSSLHGSDYMPYRPPLYLEVDSEGKVIKGPPSKLIEIPTDISLDDFPHFMYMRYHTNLLHTGLRSVSDVLENWVLSFEYMVNNLDEGVIVYVFHPEVIGRGHTMILLERLINHIKTHKKRDEVSFLKMIDIANIYSKKL